MRYRAAMRGLSNSDNDRISIGSFASTIAQSPSIISDTPGNMSAVVENNKVAILSLAVLVGEDRIRTLARFRFSLNSNNVEKLRTVLRLIRNDLSKHFWASAGLTVLSGEKQAIAVGVGKELMDSAPGGSGFCSWIYWLIRQAFDSQLTQ